MKDLYASRDPEEEVRKAFALFDEDGTGKVCLYMYILLCVWLVYGSVNRPSAVVRPPTDSLAQSAHTQTQITLKNLKRVARELGETGVSEEELQAMIDEFDK